MVQGDEENQEIHEESGSTSESESNPDWCNYPKSIHDCSGHDVIFVQEKSDKEMDVADRCFIGNNETYYYADPHDL